MNLNIYISQLICGMMLIMFPFSLAAQESDRTKVLMEDIARLTDRAVKDNVIDKKEHEEIRSFIRDSLPENLDIRISTLEKIRNELDSRYAEMMIASQDMSGDYGYLAKMMIPRLLHEPKDYVSDKERQHSLVMAGLEVTRKQTQEYLEYMKPLQMPSWLKTVLRLLFGLGVNQRPERWDQTVVPQMGGLYNIILPGGKPDYSWMDAPKMEYDLHPDKHYRH